jgi:hypothetical protein
MKLLANSKMSVTLYSKHRALQHKILSALLLALIGTIIGCGERPPARAIVTGTVTYEGKAVELGDIVFQPMSQGSGKWFAQGKIVGGKYSLDAAHGPLEGKNLVQIRGYKMTGRKRLDIAGKSLSETPQMIDELVPYIPEKFNEASELTVEIRPGNNENINFSL